MKQTNMGMSWRTRAAALITTAALGGAVAFGAVAPVAWAASGETGAVTINSATGKSVEYRAYRLFTADVELVNDAESATLVNWSDEVDAAAVAEQLDAITDGGYSTWLQGKDAAQDAKTKAQNAFEFINEQLKSTEDGGGHAIPWADSDTFAVKFASWVAKEQVGLQNKNATSGEKYSNYEGYYLFLSDATSFEDEETVVGTAPIWIALGGSEKKVSEKAASPTIQKQVQENSSSKWGEYADAELKKSIPYKIDVTVPGNYNTFETFYMKISDQLPKGMIINEGSVEIKVGDTDITKNFEVVGSDTTLSAECMNTKLIKEITGPNTVITLTYTAKLIDDFVLGSPGNVNTATLEFSNNPQNSGDGTTKPEDTGSIDDDAKVYTFGTIVTKLDKATQVKLAGAQFVIKNAEGKFLSDNNAFDMDDQAKAKTFVTNANGVIDGIKGLDANVAYTLIETKAPDGYKLPADADFTLTLKPTYGADGMLTKLEAQVDGAIAENGSADENVGNAGVNVFNDKSISLAMTGAEGVGLAGAGVLGIGLAWYLVRNHRKNGEQA